MRMGDGGLEGGKGASMLVSVECIGPTEGSGESRPKSWSIITTRPPATHSASSCTEVVIDAPIEQCLNIPVQLPHTY